MPVRTYTQDSMATSWPGTGSTSASVRGRPAVGGLVIAVAWPCASRVTTKVGCTTDCTSMPLIPSCTSTESTMNGLSSVTMSSSPLS